MHAKFPCHPIPSDPLKLHQEVQRAVKEAKSIVIIGAGPIGIESAGEIVDVYGPGEKNITLVGSAEYLAQANATPKMQRGIQKLLDSGLVPQPLHMYRALTALASAV